MKLYYSEFVNHCLRFYVRYPSPRFRTDVEKKNWNACDLAFKSFSDSDKELLTNLYSDSDTMSDNVYQLAKRNNISQDAIWKLIGELERKVAKRRGLL